MILLDQGLHCNDLYKFRSGTISQVKRFHKPIMVSGIKRGLPAVGVGKVRITNRNGRTRVLKNVLYMPKLKNNLLSLMALTLARWRSVLQMDYVQLQIVTL